MIFPTLSLSGTSPESLLAQTCLAGTAVNDAIKAMSEAAPNARDYSPDNFKRAIAEFDEQMGKLRSVYSWLTELAENISTQWDERQ